MTVYIATQQGAAAGNKNWAWGIFTLLINH